MLYIICALLIASLIVFAVAASKKRATLSNKYAEEHLLEEPEDTRDDPELIQYCRIEAERKADGDMKRKRNIFLAVIISVFITCVIVTIFGLDGRYDKCKEASSLKLYCDNTDLYFSNSELHFTQNGEEKTLSADNLVVLKQTGEERYVIVTEYHLTNFWMRLGHKIVTNISVH